MLRSLAGALLLLSFGSIISGAYGAAWIAVVCGASIARARGVRRGLSDLDDLISSGERAVVAVSLLVMSLAVFVDVVWRTGHSLEGRSVWTLPLAIFVLTMIGAFTAQRPGGVLRRAAGGLAVYALMALACFAVYSAPNGFGWSQTLAMVLLLWVGMIGSSMATREGRHIAVDAVKRIVPDRLQRLFEITAGVITVVLSAFLTTLAVLYCRKNWIDWSGSGGRSFLFESIPIPYWVATLPIPIGFGLTSARFLAVTIYGSKPVDLLTSVGGGELEAKP